MAQVKYYEVKGEAAVLSSGGETEAFGIMQKDFNKMFKLTEADKEIEELQPIFPGSDVWSFEHLSIKPQAKRKLLKKIESIKQIPSYKYILMFLLLENKYAIGNENIKGLWEYLENNKKFKCTKNISATEENAFKNRLNREQGTKAVAFADADYKILLSLLLIHLKESYEQNGYEKASGWDDYFRTLLFEPNDKYIRELAFAYQMEYKLYAMFRKKVLRAGDVNFFKREHLFTYFVLKYAKDCGEYRFFDAYELLNKKYPVQKIVKNTSIEEIGKKLTEYLEDENGSMKKVHRENFFKARKRDENLSDLLKEIDEIKIKDRKKKREQADVKNIITYLLESTGVKVTSEVLEGFVNYIAGRNEKQKFEFQVAKYKEEDLRIKIETKGQELAETDYEILLAIICSALKEKYIGSGYQKKNWQGICRQLFYNPEREDIEKFALAYQMKYDEYLEFCRSILGTVEKDFCNSREKFYSYCVMQYGKECKEKRYFRAHERLMSKYSTKTGNDKQKVYTKEIRESLTRYLEDVRGVLRVPHRSTFFQMGKQDERILEVLMTVDNLDKKVSARTAEKVFMEIWKHFEKEMEESREAEVIFESLGRANDGNGYYLGKQNIYRWLYGANVNRVERAQVERDGELVVQTRIVDISDDEMEVLKKADPDYFLDSKVFLETRIQDRTFANFPDNEERQRNLLLTVVFLEFAMDEFNLADKYQDRVKDFEIKAERVLKECGFQELHSGKAYDAYLKLLLSCEAPITLFRYIWSLKTKSLE